MNSDKLTTSFMGIQLFFSDGASALSALFAKGGVMMFPIVFCSLIMILIIVERLLVLRHSHLFPSLLHDLKQRVTQNPQSPALFEPSLKHPVGRIFNHGVSLLPCSISHFKEALRDQARQERHEMERGLVVLEIIVGIAPLLGLLGTVLGMVDVFANLSLEGAGRAEALSRGISEALFTTVSGLAVGIPALIAYNLFFRKIDSLSLRMEQEIMFLVSQMFSKKK